MKMTLKTRAALGPVLVTSDPRHIVYWVVGGIVTIYLWTVAPLRDSVEDLRLGLSVAIIGFGSFAGVVAQHTEQIVQTFSFSACVLICLHAMRGCYAGASASVVVRANDGRKLRAVRT